MQRLIVVATLKSPHGVKGECKLFSHSGEINHLKELTAAILRFNGHERQIEIEHVRGTGKNPIAKIKGLDSPEAVKELGGAEILVERDKASKLSQGEYYIADLVGCRICVSETTRGVVVSVWENSASDLLETKLTDGRVVHIPMIDQFIAEVDIPQKCISLVDEWILQ